MHKITLLNKNYHIAYITTFFPLRSQTFVYREVIELRKKGLQVSCFSIKKPGHVPQEVKWLSQETIYLWPIHLLKFMKAHLNFLLKNPANYLKIFKNQLMRKKDQTYGLRRGVIHFFEGVYFAYLCVQKKVKHIHAHFAHGPASVALIASKISGIPYSFTAHANDIFVYKWDLKEKIHSAKFVVTISKFNKNYLSGLANHEDQKKIYVIPCGVDPAQYSREELSADGGVTILTVARLVEKKGIRYLIKACDYLKKWGISFRCKIIGEGDQSKELQALVKRLGLEQHVFFLGALESEEVRSQLKEADIFVLPSIRGKDGDQDGIPVSLMEAMATGIPCVSTYVSGIPELIQNFKNGRLVPPGKPGKLAKVLAELILNPDLRRVLGNAARETITSKFNLAINTAKLFEVFKNKTNCHVGMESKNLQSKKKSIKSVSRPRVKIISLDVDNVTESETIEAIEKIIKARTPKYICTANVDHIIKCKTDAEFAHIYKNAALSVPDGVPLLWASRMLKKPLKERVNGTNLFIKLCEVSARKNYTVFFLGGPPGVAEKASKKLKAKFPGLNVTGCYAPPPGFEKDVSENEKILDMINKSRPDILFVGLGAPKQEKWISRNLSRLKVPVSIGIGASFEYVAGKTRRAPCWMQRAGLEWFYRVIENPKRYWKRYFIDDMKFFPLLIKQILLGGV